MTDLSLETVECDIDELRETIQKGFLDMPLLEDVAPYQSASLAIALRKASGEIEGGVIGHSVWGWLYVQYLWVTERRRGGGFGKRLLDAAEREAERRGCHGVWLHTLSFQAPEFYEHQGYQRFGELPDMPIGHNRYFYRKRLTPKR